MNEIITLVITSVITFLVYETMRTLFDKIKDRKRNKKKLNYRLRKKPPLKGG